MIFKHVIHPDFILVL